MVVFDKLTNENVMLYAAKHYSNPTFSDIEEFYEDLKRFKYIKRLVNKYIETGDLSERLILNHIITVFNVFGIEAALNICELKFNHSQLQVIKPFLVYLRYIKHDQLIGIVQDQKVIEVLRKI
jgi:hypothetical protein